MRDPLTLHAKRRLCWFALTGGTCFLGAGSLFVLEDGGIIASSPQFLFYCSMLLFSGYLLYFKALETWSFPEDYTGRRHDEEQHLGKHFAIAFYIQAALMAVIIMLLLLHIGLSSRPTELEFFATALGLGVAAVFVFFGYQASIQTE